MLNLVLAAALWAAADAGAAEPPALILYGDHGAPGRPGNLERLLLEWAEEGLILHKPRRGETGSLKGCLGGRGSRRVDASCIRRLHAGAGNWRSPVVIVALDSGRVTPVLRVTCVGPAGEGQAEVNMNTGGAFSVVPRQRAKVRRGVASCISAAADGAVADRPCVSRRYVKSPIVSDYSLLLPCVGPD